MKESLLGLDSWIAAAEEVSPTKCDGAKMAIFGDFFASCISASRVQHISDLHSKFALRPHHVWKYGRQTSSVRPLRLGEERKKDTRRRRRRKKLQDENIMVCPIP